MNEMNSISPEWPVRERSYLADAPHNRAPMQAASTEPSHAVTVAQCVGPREGGAAAFGAAGGCTSDVDAAGNTQLFIIAAYVRTSSWVQRQLH